MSEMVQAGVSGAERSPYLIWLVLFVANGVSAFLLFWNGYPWLSGCSAGFGVWCFMHFLKSCFGDRSKEPESSASSMNQIKPEGS